MFTVLSLVLGGCVCDWICVSVCVVLCVACAVLLIVYVNGSSVHVESVCGC